jgi:hypothetical protein
VGHFPGTDPKDTPGCQQICSSDSFELLSGSIINFAITAEKENLNILE